MQELDAELLHCAHQVRKQTDTDFFWSSIFSPSRLTSFSSLRQWLLLPACSEELCFFEVWKCRSDGQLVKLVFTRFQAYSSIIISIGLFASACEALAVYCLTLLNSGGGILVHILYCTKSSPIYGRFLYSIHVDEGEQTSRLKYSYNFDVDVLYAPTLRSLYRIWLIFL